MNHKDINIVFFSDTHLGFDYPLRPRVNKRRRGEDFFRNFEAVLSYAKKNKADFIIHGGDLFFRSKVPNPIIDRVYLTLSAFADLNIPIYIVPGNHERSRLPTSLFLNHPLIHIFDRPKTYSMAINDAHIIICGFPFIRENVRDNFQSILDRTGWKNEFSDIKILVFHQAIEGAKVGPKNYTFQNSDDVIPLSHLPLDATIVLCGHIHRQQKLHRVSEGKGPPIPVIFSGSTERTSFAEKDEEKGFYHLNFIHNNKQNWRLNSSNFIGLPARNMRYIYIDPEIEPGQLKDYLRKELDQTDPDTIIRFRSSRPTEKDLAHLLTSINLRDMLPPGINFGFSSNFFNSHF